MVAIIAAARKVSGGMSKYYGIKMDKDDTVRGKVVADDDTIRIHRNRLREALLRFFPGISSDERLENSFKQSEGKNKKRRHKFY